MHFPISVSFLAKKDLANNEGIIIGIQLLNNVSNKSRPKFDEVLCRQGYRLDSGAPATADIAS